MKRSIGQSIVAVSALALLGGCASSKGAEKGGTAAPKEERERLQNVGYFDVGTCNPKPPAVPERVTSEVLLGVMIAAEPQVMECLVDPKNRGPEADTKVTLDQSLTDTGVRTVVGGTNVTPEGQKCITDALDKWTSQLPSLKAKNAYSPKTAEGAKPVAGHFEVQHRVGVSPSVKLGNNWASDVVGQIRLAQPQWCDCFAAWDNNAPHALKATVTFVKPKTGELQAPPTEVAFEPTGDAAADKVAGCMKDKLMAMKFPATSSDKFQLPVPFSFINSNSTQPLGQDASPQVAFSQFDATRAKKNAAAVIAVGEMTYARNGYGDLVDKYKRTKDWKLVSQLKDKCKTMLKADDAFISALKNQVQVETQTHEFASNLKAQNPQWADAEAASAQQAQQTQQQLTDTQKQRAGDEASCPKEHY